MDEADDVENKKKHKKSKDKKKHDKEKSEETVDEVVDVVEETVETDASEKKKSKKKKDKKEKSLIEDIDDATVPNHSNSSSVSSPNLYKEHSTTKSMSHNDVKVFRDDLAIQVFPEEEGDIYKPMTSLECLNPSLGNNCPFVQQYIQEKNFTKPSPIQVCTN